MTIGTSRDTTTTPVYELRQLDAECRPSDEEKGTPGKLTVATRQDENRQIIVWVTDTGVGLPPGHAERIFNTLFTSKPQDTGMGLPISRSII